MASYAIASPRRWDVGPGGSRDSGALAAGGDHRDVAHTGEVRVGHERGLRPAHGRPDEQAVGTVGLTGGDTDRAVVVRRREAHHPAPAGPLQSVLESREVDTTA